MYKISKLSKSKSELRMVQFDRSRALHHILESSYFCHVISTTSSEMTHSWWFILGVRLFANSRTCVISLILINPPHFIIGPSCLWQSPSRKVLFIGGVCWGFGNISTRTYWARCWSLIFQSTSASSSETECIMRSFYKFRAIFRQILRAWCGF